MDSLVGFRFRPTNEEIILLLKKKRLDPDFSVRTVKEIDFYDFDPWDLPRHSEIQSKEPIWYFYCKPYYKYSKSKRAHRRTISGYWKITGRGSDMKAKNSKDVIGSKKILSFYLHDPVSKEAKPEWVMHEIHIKDNDPLYKEDFVVCRLERRRDNKPRISTSNDGESSQHLVVAENTSPKSVLPPNQQFVSNMNNIGEKTFPLSHKLKLRLQSNQYCDDYNALDNDSFSELQLPIDPEQGSSYSNSPNNCSFLLNSQCDSEQVDNLNNSQRGFQNEYSCEETGQTLSPKFNLSKTDEGEETGQTFTPELNSSISDGSEMDTESFVAWVNRVFKY